MTLQTKRSDYDGSGEPDAVRSERLDARVEWPALVEGFSIVLDDALLSSVWGIEGISHLVAGPADDGVVNTGHTVGQGQGFNMTVLNGFQWPPLLEGTLQGSAEGSEGG